MPSIPKRICITAKDIANIKNCSQRNARLILSDIKSYFNKEEKHKMITFNEFSQYTGISLTELEPFR